MNLGTLWNCKTAPRKLNTFFSKGEVTWGQAVVHTGLQTDKVPEEQCTAFGRFLLFQLYL